MIWVLIVLGTLAALALLFWWLEQPLWHSAHGMSGLESYLTYLISPTYPWPSMYVQASGRECLLLVREWRDDALHLRLEVLPKVAQGQALHRMQNQLKIARFAADQLAVVERDGDHVLR